MPVPLTTNQAKILAALRRRPGHALTAYQVLESLQVEGIRGPQTVYRALDALLRAGLAHRIESLNAFTACTHHDHGHPAHRPAFAVCRSCGRIAELDDQALSAVLGVVEERTGFEVEERVVELVGRCSACASCLPA